MKVILKFAGGAAVHGLVAQPLLPLAKPREASPSLYAHVALMTSAKASWWEVHMPVWLSTRQAAPVRGLKPTNVDAMPCHQHQPAAAPTRPDLPASSTIATPCAAVTT